MRTWRNEEQIVGNRRIDIRRGWGVLQFLISPSKGNEKKEVITTRGIRFWSPIQEGIPQNGAQLLVV